MLISTIWKKCEILFVFDITVALINNKTLNLIVKFNHLSEAKNVTF